MRLLLVVKGPGDALFRKNPNSSVYHSCVVHSSRTKIWSPLHIRWWMSISTRWKSNHSRWTLNLLLFCDIRCRNIGLCWAGSDSKSTRAIYSWKRSASRLSLFKKSLLPHAIGYTAQVLLVHLTTSRRASVSPPWLNAHLRSITTLIRLNKRKRASYSTRATHSWSKWPCKGQSKHSRNSSRL